MQTEDFITGESLQGLGRGDAEFVGEIEVIFSPFAVIRMMKLYPLQT